MLMQPSATLHPAMPIYQPTHPWNPPAVSSRLPSTISTTTSTTTTISISTISAAPAASRSFPSTTRNLPFQTKYLSFTPLLSTNRHLFPTTILTTSAPCPASISHSAVHPTALTATITATATHLRSSSTVSYRTNITSNAVPFPLVTTMSPPRVSRISSRQSIPSTTLLVMTSAPWQPSYMVTSKPPFGW